MYIFLFDDGNEEERGEENSWRRAGSEREELVGKMGRWESTVWTEVWEERSKTGCGGLSYSLVCSKSSEWEVTFWTM